jgi:hypothetical protein
MLAFAASAGSVPVWSADVASDAALLQRQTSFLSSLQTAVASAAAGDSKNVDVKSTAHQLIVTLLDSTLNDGAMANREAQAANIVASLATAIANKPDFAQVVIIHVDYVKRTGNAAKIVQAIDFYKSPAGAFYAHKS